MPFPVDNIRSACAKRNTSLKQLEKDLGIGNGVIAKWEKAKNSPPYDRIVSIAEHLNVSVSYLTGEDQKENPTEIPGEVMTQAQKKAVDLIMKMSEAQLDVFIAVAEQMLGG